MKAGIRAGLWGIMVILILLSWLWVRYENSVQEFREIKDGFRMLSDYAERLIEDKHKAGAEPWYIESVSELARYAPMGDQTIGAVGNPFPGILPDGDYVVRATPTTSPDDILLYGALMRRNTRFRLYADGQYEFLSSVTTDGREGRDAYYWRYRSSTTRP